MASLPKVGQRMILTAGITSIEVEPDLWLPMEQDEDKEDAVTEVTVIARDLEEWIWTVWDHSAEAIRLIAFDENGNWRWFEPDEDILNNQN